MRVLLDENLPRDLAGTLTGHIVSTVQEMGWAGLKNGDLLTRASGRIDALLTMDQQLEREHDLSVVPYGVVILRARSNRIADLRPLVREILDALRQCQPGTVEHVGV